jgi:hypothetical protein
MKRLLSKPAVYALCLMGCFLLGAIVRPIVTKTDGSHRKGGDGSAAEVPTQTGVRLDELTAAQSRNESEFLLDRIDRAVAKVARLPIADRQAAWLLLFDFIPHDVDPRALSEILTQHDAWTESGNHYYEWLASHDPVASLRGGGSHFAAIRRGVMSGDPIEMGRLLMTNAPKMRSSHSRRSRRNSLLAELLPKIAFLDPGLAKTYVEALKQQSGEYIGYGEPDWRALALSRKSHREKTLGVANS